VQFNDGGAFAGASGWTWNKTTNTMTLASGTQTTSNPAQSVTQTWNASGVTFVGKRTNITDTTSAANSLIEEWQVGGVSQASVRKDGAIFVRYDSTRRVLSSTSGANGFQLYSGGFGVQIERGDSAHVAQFFSSDPACFLVNGVGFGPAGGARQVIATFDAANVWAHRNGSAAQEHRVYGTFIDASNYRRLSKGMSTSGVAFLRPEGAGTGASGNVLHISGLPTSNPGPGILWNDAGTVKVGT
jgi:hypothetical protein